MGGSFRLFGFASRFFLNFGRCFIDAAQRFDLGLVFGGRCRYALPGDDSRFLFAAKFVHREGLKRSSAGLFDDLSTRPFVDDGVVHHFDVGDIDGLVDDGGIIDDGCGADWFQEAAWLDEDEGPRGDTTAAALGALKPAFHAQGQVTAGNSSQMSDGAAAAVVMSAEKAQALGIKPLARFVAFATAGYKPEEMGLGPVFAIPKALKMAGLKLDQIDVFELNEAFAAQALAVIKEAELPLERINPNGGAIALGHPLGCTGAKLVATIIRELKRRKGRYGVVTMCIGGGMGAAGIIENLN